MTPHWAIELIGKPWVNGARGPLAFDCFGLLVYGIKKVRGLDVPPVEGISAFDTKEVLRLMRSHPELRHWVQIQKPVDCCAVGMSNHIEIHHTGLYADVEGGLVVHACEGKGVIAQSISRLKADGWRRIDFYAHRSWLTS